MAKKTAAQLSRRERQIMDIIYKHGKLSAAEVLEQMSDPPSYSAVRAMLRILEDKGHLKHQQDGPRYVYVPTVGHNTAKRSALRHLLQTFFDNSAEQAMAALLDESHNSLSPQALERMALLIEQAKKEGR
jgi:predicted transcriptional regulator